MESQPQGSDAASGRYDAFLLLSFGGPNGPDEVMPFLRNVTRGRGIPDVRLTEVAQHYWHYDGVSPINDQNRALLAALADEFTRAGIDLPLYWGNRNWEPYVEDVVQRMRDDGVRRAVVLATSATTSYSSCRQYREDLARAAERVQGGIELVKIRHFFDHPGFIAANADGLRTALAELPQDERDTARLVFTAHSVPDAMNAISGPERNGLYAAQQRETARLVSAAVRGAGAEFDMVWQSRSGPPSVPWLEPDVNDHLRKLAAGGTRAVVVCPTGFVSDHMEVMWDLDNEARDTAAEVGLRFARAATAGTHPAFVTGLTDLVREVLDGAQERPHLGRLGVCGLDCPAGCCPAPQRRPAA